MGRFSEHIIDFKTYYPVGFTVFLIKLTNELCRFISDLSLILELYLQQIYSVIENQILLNYSHTLFSLSIFGR